MIKNFLFVGLLYLSSQGVNAATLNVSGGQLLGASNVDIAGVGVYDVVFAGGSCVSIFDGCDEISDFAFDNQADAVAASQALLDQVFIDDGVLGAFDVDPNLTFGCGPSSFACEAITPFGLTIGLVELALASNRITGDLVRAQAFVDVNQDWSAVTSINLAVWTPINPVPVPAAVWLFGTALIGLVGFGKREARIAA